MECWGPAHLSLGAGRAPFCFCQRRFGDRPPGREGALRETGLGAVRASRRPGALTGRPARSRAPAASLLRARGSVGCGLEWVGDTAAGVGGTGCP